METTPTGKEGIIFMDWEFFRNIGIMQGRLSDSPPNVLSYFPQDTWEDEFYLAKKIGLNHIEIIVEEEYNANNPVWSKMGRDRLIALQKDSGVNVISACYNCAVNYSIFGKYNFGYMVQFLENMQCISVKKIILPLLEASEVVADKFEECVLWLRKLANFASEWGIQICIETNMNGTDLMALLKKINHNSLGVCYDVGNCSCLRHNIVNDMLYLQNWIEHIHFKDKNEFGHNVMLGTGVVNFTDVFETLKKIEYQGFCTLETTRGDKPNVSAKMNLDFLKKFQ